MEDTNSKETTTSTFSYFDAGLNVYKISGLFISLVLIFYLIVHWILLCRNRRSVLQYQGDNTSRIFRG